MSRIVWELKLYKHSIYRKYSQALLGQNEDSSAPRRRLAQQIAWMN